MKIRYRYFLIGLLVFTIFNTAGVGHAQTLDPALNTLCWKKDDCIENRKKFFHKDGTNLSAEDQKRIEEGWVQNEGDCKGADWGKCLPGMQTVTEISFAGQTKFLHVGDFIVTMYKFALIAAGIVAAIMVIWAGFQWTMSGGNSEAISSAQHKIVGVITGLFIAYGSYFILININPDLVNLRIPQVWMVRPQSLVPKFCSALGPTNKFALVPGSDSDKQNISIPEPKNISYSLSFKNNSPSDKNERNFYCGKQFFVENGGKATCWGNYCDNEGTCVFDVQTKLYSCQKGKIFGTVTHNSLTKEFFPDLFTEEWENPTVDDLQLRMLCSDGSVYDVAAASLKNSVDEKTISFALDFVGSSQELTKKCSSGFKGFYLRLEMNENSDPADEVHCIGKNGVDLGDSGVASGFWNDKRTKIDNKYFFTAGDIESGLNINIEAAKILDVDSEKDRNVYYQRFGISR